MVRRGRLPGGAPRPRATRSSRPTSRTATSTPRDRRDFLFGYRQTIEDLDAGRDPPHPRLVRRRGAARAQAAASTASSCTSPTPTRWPRSSPSRTGAPTPTAAASRTACACPCEVIAGRARGGGPRSSWWAAATSAPRTSWATDGVLRGNTSRTRRRIGVELARAGLDFLSVSRGGKFEDAQQPPVGEADVSLHGPQRAQVHPAREAATRRP